MHSSPAPRRDEAGRPDLGRGAPSRLLVVDDNEDHSLLIAEVLELAFPDASIERASTDTREEPPAPDVLVAATNTDRDRLVEWLEGESWSSRSTRIVVVGGPGERWSSLGASSDRIAAEVDKRAGAEFATLLAPAVEKALREGDGGTAEAGHDARSQRSMETEDAPEPERKDDAPVEEEAPPAPRERNDSEAARQLLVAGLLVDQLGEILGRLEPLGGLFVSRAPDDRATERYAECLAGELRRAGALRTQLAALCRAQGAGSSPRILDLGGLVRLRLPAWRSLLPGSAEIAVDLDETPPLVEAWPDLLGPALDDVLGYLVGRCGGHVHLEVATEAQHVDAADDGRAAVDLPSGRYARLRVVVSSDSLRDDTEAGRRAEAAQRASWVARAHGGRFEGIDERRDGRALAATFLLPESDGRRRIAQEQERAKTPRRSVLLVDDDPDICSVQREIIESRGIRVAEAANGHEAIALVRAGCRYDVILLDMQMPGLDGRETYHEVKRIDPDARVIIVSGSVTSTVLRGLLGEGLLGYLPKPFSVNDLLAMVDAAMAT